MFVASLLSLLACDGEVPTVDSEDSAPVVSVERLRFTRFAEVDGVQHEQVPTALFEAEGDDVYMRSFYVWGGADTAGPGGVSGEWVEGEGSYPYQLWVPEGADGPLPLSLILHTRGEQGSDNGRQINTDLARIWTEQMEVPTVLLAPQAPDGARSWSVSDLDALLNEIMVEQDIDTSRLFLSGHSFGGAGALAMLSGSEHSFTAAAMFAPSGDDYDSLDLDRMATVPQWYVVSELDTISDADRVEGFFDALVEVAGL